MNVVTIMLFEVVLLFLVWISCYCACGQYISNTSNDHAFASTTNTSMYKKTTISLDHKNMLFPLSY